VTNVDIIESLARSRDPRPTPQQRCPAASALICAASVILVLMLVSAFAGCSHIEPRVKLVEPTSARPEQAVVAPANNGAIFQLAGHRPLFEDPRARLRGDIITIAINEKNSASRTSSSTTSKTNEVKAGVPAVAGLPGKFFQGANLQANSSNAFSGKGDTANDNAFTGTITVTVVNVLPNGNLVVAGEKQIGINHNLEFIRFSGVVNPVTLQAGNQVESTKVADARLEYTGKGYIDEAQRMGWLSRFFLTFLPF
jgi:flagellar L-ring protein precursor FlgH